MMQENRSFDHYFGSLHGVRGFGDRTSISVTVSPDSSWSRRFAGHLENGQPSITG